MRITASKNTKYMCISCNHGVQISGVRSALESGKALEDLECPFCKAKTIYFRGKNLGTKGEKPFWNFLNHKSITVRRFRQFVVSGKTFNGMPFVERDGLVYAWDVSRNWDNWRKEWKWECLVSSRSAYMKKYKYRRDYELAGWNFDIQAARKNKAVEEFSVRLIGEEQENLDFAPVIQEAAKYGFNATEDFLQEQVNIIRQGFKQNRFLPDRSGAVFSPIRDNGIVFRFAKITEETPEYVC